jgi:hypothetical protein
LARTKEREPAEHHGTSSRSASGRFPDRAAIVAVKISPQAAGKFNGNARKRNGIWCVSSTKQTPQTVIAATFTLA